MSMSAKFVLGLCLVGFLGACARQEEEVVFVEPTPIVAEPVFSKF